MAITTAESAATALIAALIAAETEEARLALVAQHPLDPEALHAAVLTLVEEAVRTFGIDPHLMERVARGALALARHGADEFAAALAQLRLADAISAQGRNQEALALFDTAAAQFIRLGRPLEAARTRVGWMRAAVGLGRPDDALTAARVARRIFVAHGETARIATLDMHVGNIHTQYGRNDKGLKAYSSARRLYESLGEAERVGATRARYNQSISLSRLGRYTEALAELEHVRAGFLETGQRVDYALTIQTLVEIQLNVGRYAAALRTYEEAKPNFAALDLPNGAVSLAIDLSDCYLRLNRPADALRVLQEVEHALRRIERVPDAIAIAFRRIAALLLLGRGQQALAEMDEAEQRFPVAPVQERAWLAIQRARALLTGGAPAEALETAQRAAELGRAARMRRFAAEAALLEGSALLALDRVDSAERAADRAGRLAARLDAAPLLHRAYELQGRIAEARDRRGAAVRRYATAIRHLEREQRNVIFEFREGIAVTRGLAYERLTVLQLRAGQAHKALATAESAKSRALTDAISGAVEWRPRGSARTRRLAHELEAARTEYAVAARAAPMGAADVGTVRAAAVMEPPRLLEEWIAQLIERLQIAAQADGFAYADGVATGERVPSLPADTALVEFFASGDDLLRFFVHRGRVEGQIIAGGVAQVQRLVLGFRTNLVAMESAEPHERGPLTQQAQRVLQRLYTLLLDRLDGLDPGSALVVVPHGLLHYLPFHALHDGERYVIERRAVSYAPSATLYALCRARPPAGPRRRRSLVLGHSAEGALPFTLSEAATVGKVLGVRAYIEAQATRGLLERLGRHASVIHLAAHGVFRPDAPLFSALQLADGPLTTADVFNLDLRGAFVALSACETGRAVVGGGDELVGLARAFFCAGASGLLLSQWRVDDASTAALMARFYTECRQPGTASRAEALRRAQIARLHGAEAVHPGGDHPFYWAGFQIVGDERNSD